MAGIQVYGYVKPTLSLSVEEGGSLLANTTYYVFGIMRGVCYFFSYQNVYGPISELYTISTTSTAKSIRINHKHYRDIQGFTNAGGGLVNVQCTRHCLKTGDEIHIPSGTYSGVYYITYVDYHNFTITATYSITETSTCYTDTANYNSSFGMIYWVSEYSPWDGNGVYTHRYAYTDNEWTNNNIAQDVLISSPPVGFLYSLLIPKCNGMSRGTYKFLDTDGLISVVVSKNITILDVYNEVQASGFTYNAAYIDGYSRSLTLAGTIVMTSTYTFTGSYLSLIIVQGELLANFNNQISFLQSVITIIYGGYQTYNFLTLTDGVYFNGAFQNPNQAFPIYGTNSVGYCMGNWNQGTYDYIDPTDNLPTLANKTYFSVGGWLQTVAGVMKLRNMTFYVPLFVGILDGQPDKYFLENVKVMRPYVYGCNIVEYSYLGDSYFNRIKCLNVDTDDINNYKNVYDYAAAANCQWDFYRRSTVKIIDSNNDVISNVNIKVTDNASNVYNFQTDITGIANVDVIEQICVVAHQYPSNNVNTYFNNFSIEISKNGYETITEYYPTLLGSPLLTYELKPVVKSRVSTEGNVLLSLQPALGSNSQIAEL
jgi:hypothetical protein